VLCGDSTKAQDVARLMNGSKAQMVFTDPPYGMSYKGTTFGKQGIQNDTETEFEEVVSSAITLVFQFLENGVVAVCFGSSRLDALFRACTGMRFHRLLTIYKPNRMAHPWHGWIMTQEHILLFSHGEPQFNDTQHCHDVYTFDYSERPDRNIDHPTVKPLSIVSDVVCKCSKQTNLIYDPFLGSGTTLIAAEQLNRKCYGMEISPAYCDVIVQRWENLTGKKATHG
jgi:DNA modification methylase